MKRTVYVFVKTYTHKSVFKGPTTNAVTPKTFFTVSFNTQAANILKQWRKTSEIPLSTSTTYPSNCYASLKSHFILFNLVLTKNRSLTDIKIAFQPKYTPQFNPFCYTACVMKTVLSVDSLLMYIIYLHLTTLKQNCILSGRVRYKALTPPQLLAYTAMLCKFLQV